MPHYVLTESTMSVTQYWYQAFSRFFSMAAR